MRSGIGLRSYGQRDPLVEYKAESYQMFERLVGAIERDAVNLFFRAELAPPPQPVPEQDVSQVETRHSELSAYEAGPAPRRPAIQGATNAPEAAKARPIEREAPKVGRNDPCPCGSGKKYKKCCGAG